MILDTISMTIRLFYSYIYLEYDTLLFRLISHKYFLLCTHGVIERPNYSSALSIRNYVKNIVDHYLIALMVVIIIASKHVILSWDLLKEKDPTTIMRQLEINKTWKGCTHS